MAGRIGEGSSTIPAWVAAWCVVAAVQRGPPWGYHQLDPGVAASIVAAAGIGPGDLVLDLGAGTGALTAPLLRTGARVIAVEAHPGRAAALRRRFAGSTLQIWQVDLIRLRLPDEPFTVVANPPWALAETVRSRLLGARELRRADLLVPRWLARRWADADRRITVGRSVRAEAFRPAARTGAAVALLRPSGPRGRSPRRRRHPGRVGAADAAGPAYG